MSVRIGATRYVRKCKPTIAFRRNHDDLPIRSFFCWATHDLGFLFPGYHLISWYSEMCAMVLCLTQEQLLRKLPNSELKGLDNITSYRAYDHTKRALVAWRELGNAQVRNPRTRKAEYAFSYFNGSDEGNAQFVSLSSKHAIKIQYLEALVELAKEFKLE